jgi:hypothetical protein
VRLQGANCGTEQWRFAPTNLLQPHPPFRAHAISLLRQAPIKRSQSWSRARQVCLFLPHASHATVASSSPRHHRPLSIRALGNMSGAQYAIPLGAFEFYSVGNPPTATPTPTPTPTQGIRCVGDCDGSSDVAQHPRSKDLRTLRWRTVHGSGQGIVLMLLAVCLLPRTRSRWRASRAMM